MSFVPDTDPELRAFLAGVWDSPADRTGWLALADWLDERDDPRGAWVRASATGDDSRAGRWLREHAVSWLGDLGPGWNAVLDPEPPGLRLESRDAEHWPERLVAAAEAGWVTLDLGPAALERCGSHAPSVRSVIVCGWETERVSEEEEAGWGPASWTETRVRVRLGKIQTGPLLRLPTLARLRITQSDTGGHTRPGEYYSASFHDLLSADDLRVLGNLSELRELTVSGVGPGVGEWASALRGLSRLRVLDLTHSHVEVADWEWAFDLPSLVRFGANRRQDGYPVWEPFEPTDRWVRWLVRTGQVGERIELGAGAGDAALTALAAVPGLREVRITGEAAVTPAGVGEIARMTGLRVLELKCRSLTDATALATLTNLERLDLNGCVGLRTVFGRGAVGFENLRTLAVRFTAITDAELAGAVAVTTLRHLDLTCCPGVTDAAIPTLSRMRHLERLWVARSGLSSDGRTSLRRALPHCQFDGDG